MIKFLREDIDKEGQLNKYKGNTAISQLEPCYEC